MKSLDHFLRKVKRALNRTQASYEEVFLRERDRALNFFLDKGSASSADILTADFGTPNPEGLDIVDPPVIRTSFRDISHGAAFKELDEKEQLWELTNIGGRAGLDENISLNPAYMDQRQALWRKRSNTISHENIHRMQGYFRELGWENAFMNTQMSFLSAPVTGSGVWGATKRLYQKFRQACIETDFARDRKNTGEDKLKVGNYYTMEYEIQARMQEILAQGHAGWRKMPATKTELWAAMHNIGLTMPPAVKAMFDRDPQASQALHDFRVSSKIRYDVRETVREIKVAEDYGVFSDKKQAFWETGLPHIYGNLLEMYGDRLGRARMGMGISPRHTINLLTHMNQRRERMDDEEIHRLVARVEPEHVGGLLNALMTYTDKNPDAEATAARITDAVFARDDLKEALLSRTDFHRKDGLSGADPFTRALHSNKQFILAPFLKAGFDLTQPHHFHSDEGSMAARTDFKIFVENYRILQEARRDISTAPPGLRRCFNRESFVNNLEHRMSLKEAALRFVLDHHPAPDHPMTFQTLSGGVDTLSLRDLLSRAGIAPEAVANTLKDQAGATACLHQAR